MTTDKIDEFKKSLDLTLERIVKVEGELKMTIDQVIELLKITGVIPEDADRCEVYLEGQQSLDCDAELELHWVTVEDPGGET